MPATELCVIHPGGLAASCWTRLAAHLPRATTLKVLDLDTVNRFWMDDPTLTIEALAERMRARLGTRRVERVIVGWGVGGVVADALGVPARRVVVLDGAAPGAVAAPPDEAEALRTFAMYLGARRGLSLPSGGASLEQLGWLAGASASTLRRGFAEHVSRLCRDARLTDAYRPSGAPLTVVKANDSLVVDGPALGWDRFGPVERLGSGGDHYSMLTDRAAAAHLAALLTRWLAPSFTPVGRERVFATYVPA